jgi:hypothetical protein
LQKREDKIICPSDFSEGLVIFCALTPYNFTKRGDIMKFFGKCRAYSFIGFLVLVLFGSVWHFAYELSGNNGVIAAFAPVNESVWEHLKIVLFPSMILSVFEFMLYGKRSKSFISAKCLSNLLAMLFTVTAYYTYTGIIGDHYFLADVSIFIIASAIIEFLTCYLISNDRFKGSDNMAATLLTVLTAFSTQ